MQDIMQNPDRWYSTKEICAYCRGTGARRGHSRYRFDI